MTAVHGAGARSRIVGVPTAIAGSVALALTSTPAQAVEASTAAEPRSTALPAHAGGFGTGKALAAAVPATYRVKPGDTIWGIATRYGLRTADVLALNGLSTSSVIRPGQVIRLVGSAPKAKPAVEAAPKPAAKVYAVKSGDTVWAIAQKHGVSVTAVLTANGLNASSIIYPGQKLRIPGRGAASTPVAAAASKPAAKPASIGAKTHVVKPGDTVWAIAKKHKVSTAVILSANRLKASSIIYPGQKLRIPVKSVTVSVLLNDKQIENTRLIISVGRSLGVPERGIAIALGTAMVESGLRNLDHGDRDSVGLFQQRPSQGWGTAAQAQDRVRAAKAFFGGPSDPNGTRTKGLLDIGGWQKMTFAQAAQAVQGSAFPDRYAKWEKPAAEWIAAYG
jgi:LysM repeat protein